MRQPDIEIYLKDATAKNNNPIPASASKSGHTTLTPADPAARAGRYPE